jgi:hypothetical protein
VTDETDLLTADAELLGGGVDPHQSGSPRPLPGAKRPMSAALDRQCNALSDTDAHRGKSQS